MFAFPGKRGHGRDLHPRPRGAALAPFKCFAAGKTLAQAEFTSAEHPDPMGFPAKPALRGVYSMAIITAALA